MTQKKVLFQGAAIYHPSDKEMEGGAESKIIVEPMTVLAADQNAAGMVVIKKIPAEYDNKLDKVTVAISPF